MTIALGPGRWHRAASMLAALAALACEPPTSPFTLVYADRALTIDGAAAGWRAVSAGGTHTCGLRLDGSLYCWGRNTSGQLGVAVARGKCGRSQSPCEAGPRAATTTARYTTVSAGDRHTCAVTMERLLHCWGESVNFQTGVEREVFVATPTAVAPTLQFVDVGAGATHSCAVRTNGMVYCWGEGRLGALGRGDTVSSVLPRPIMSDVRFTKVRSGRWRSCALALDGDVWCWGAEWEESQGAVDFFHQRLLPQRVAGLPPMFDISVSGASICGLGVDGVALCWESNAFGQLGTGTLDGSITPTPVSVQATFSSISAGIIQSCGTTVDGRALCWGNNTFGQLGVPRPGTYCGGAGLECSTRPIDVFGQLRFASLSTGLGVHSCGVTTTSAVVCWGLGSEGQLGDGFTRDRQSLPVGVLAPVSSLQQNPGA